MHSLHYDFCLDPKIQDENRIQCIITNHNLLFASSFNSWQFIICTLCIKVKYILCVSIWCVFLTPDCLTPIKKERIIILKVLYMATYLYLWSHFKNRVITISNEYLTHLKCTNMIQLINNTKFQSKSVNETDSTYTLHRRRSLVGQWIFLIRPWNFHNLFYAMVGFGS